MAKIQGNVLYYNASTVPWSFDKKKELKVHFPELSTTLNRPPVDGFVPWW